MNMRVKTGVLAVVLVVLGTTSVFGQIYNAGGPTGTLYQGTSNVNYALNREGNRELLPPITLCAPVSAGAAAGAGNAGTFDVGDVYRLTFGSTAALTINGVASVVGSSPILASTGSLPVQVTQTAAGTAVGATASGVANETPVVVGGAVTPPPVSRVRITITAVSVGSGVNCLTVQNLRFDLGNTTNMAAGTTIGVLVEQVAGDGGATETAPLAVTVATAAFLTADGILTNTMYAFPAGALNTTQGLGTANITLGTTGVPGTANPTGFTTGNVLASTALINANSTAATNPASGTVAATIPRVFATLSGTATGTVSIQQNSVLNSTGLTTATSTPQNISTSLGGGLFRGYQTSGPDTTTLLNAAGATVGTQVEIAVSGMPTGSQVTFPANITSSTGLTIWNMTLVGSGVLTSNGTVTYQTTINEGTPYSLNGTVGVGASIDIPYTVAAGSGTGSAKFIVRVRPVSASATPSYSEINSSSVLPSQAVPTVGQWALFTVSPNTSTRTYAYVLTTGGTTSSDYDTGVVLNNTGRGTTGGPVTGGDGTFTVFFINSTSATVSSISSDATGFPDAAKVLSSGKLKPGDTWQALASELAKAAGITGAWKGQFVIVANFTSSSGFAFISQFTNPGGGATMGYVPN